MPTPERPCCICRNPFTANKFAGARQTVCARPDCRKAAKKQRQLDWLKRNPDYFRGPEHVERVRRWRRNHPDWRERQKAHTGKPVHRAESCNTEGVPRGRLQDLAPSPQDIVLLGVISFLGGSVLQDEVQNLRAECFRRGCQLLGLASATSG